MKYDINSARVDVLKIAIGGGLSVQEFNKIWVLLVQRPWRGSE